jgi:transposase
MEHSVTSERTPPGQTVITPTDAELTRRRDAAVAMALEGFTQTFIANRLNVSQPTVCRWLRGLQRTGNLKSRVVKPDEAGAVSEPPQIGRAPFLTVEQLREIEAPRPGHRWTGREFQTAIFMSFGLRYSSSYCCGLLAYLRSEKPCATRFDVHRSSKDRKAEERQP